ncbi:MAG: FkbM family methyltransferase [Okeania sp. SIO2F4]|uniref:FkbM family methyltransferase n=1 Tax=Okeania sp. SIO2F4 TaxID=2607790 RepID=UPI00142B40E7|nr:FkbM family methyltransferase [Okeania sp. SIO2F4]NES05885.1 FkbM family methyltransferase [Okeania sp. SIO2F4]
MRVENCCQALLADLLPTIDPQRSGKCLDVGVGTFAFYCQLFAELGFETIAVEPLPVKKLKHLTNHSQLKLLPICLSNRDGEQTLYLGKFAGLFNSNFSSLSAQWFGSSSNQRTVPTLTLQTLIKQEAITAITCLKLDIEGWEWQVLQQFSDLSPDLLPKVVMFEYGGGVNRSQKQKGWSPEFFNQTLQSLELLKTCGYTHSLILDFAPNTKELHFDLSVLPSQKLESLFTQECVYGNIISFLDYCPHPKEVAEICTPYYRLTFIERLINGLVSR